MQDRPDEAARFSAAETELLAALGSRIAALREEKNLNKAEAAVLARVQGSQLTRIEIGSQEPRLFTLLRLQHALGLDSIDALLGDLPSRLAAQRITES